MSVTIFAMDKSFKKMLFYSEQSEYAWNDKTLACHADSRFWWDKAFIIFNIH
jgi:hypothetical protein